MTKRVDTATDELGAAPPAAAALWLANVSVFFASVYWATNQMASWRVDVGAAMFEWERAIHALPSAAWPNRRGHHRGHLCSAPNVDYSSGRTGGLTA